MNFSEGKPTEEEEEERILPIGSDGAFMALLRELPVHENVTGISGPEPSLKQDGGAEIHPNLKGITFNFWVAQDGRCGVNFSGDAPRAPWATNLNGKVFENASQAKGWLRQEAARLSMVVT